jgi:hypothetical protein
VNICEMGIPMLNDSLSFKNFLALRAAIY